MSTVALLSAIFPVTLKWESLRLDCCGLASTSFAFGGASGVGTPQAAVRAAIVHGRSDRRSGSLNLHQLGGRRCGDRLPRVVLVKAQGQGIRSLVARLGDLVLERVSVAFANPAIELVAILVLGFRVPGFAVGQAFLADVLELGGTGEAPRPEARAGRSRRPLPIPRDRERVVDAIDRNVVDGDLLPGDGRVELEVAGTGRLVDDRAVTVEVDHGALGAAFARHQEVGVLQVGLVRLGQDVLGRWRRERRPGPTAGGERANRHDRRGDSLWARDHYCWMSDACGALTVCPVLKRSKVAEKVDPCIVLAYFSG